MDMAIENALDSALRQVPRPPSMLGDFAAALVGECGFQLVSMCATQSYALQHVRSHTNLHVC